MYIDLKQLFDILGEKVDIDYSIDLSDYELFDSRPFVTPVKVNGVAENRSGIVTVKYNCNFTMSHVCDRCLDSFEREYDEDFEHTLVVKLNSESADSYIAVGHETRLLLDELVLSDILLELPTKILCREDCKGLCSMCGTNLNHKDCHCVNTAADPRLAVLGTLLED